MSPMNKILSWDLDNFTVRLQSGVLLQTLADAAEEKGVLYPPDPGEKLATVGGNVATNAGGMRAVKYGTTRDFVRAATVVLPCGEILHLGAEVSKMSSGYNLLQLMIGSEGTLGIITELSMKLVPSPKKTVSLLGMFPDLESAIGSVPKIRMAGLDPHALEFMEKENVASVEKFLGKEVFPKKAEGEDVEAYILTTLGCENESLMDELLESAAEVFLEAGALDVAVYDTPEASRAAWTLRANTLEAMQAEFNQMDECDIVVPVPKIPDLVTYIKSLEPEIGLAVRPTGHAGDGNVHVNVCANDMPQDEFETRAKTFMDKAYAKGLELGGMISGEHGIGSAKRGYLEEALGKTQMNLMCGIKAVFDPKGLLNPGKVC